MPLTKAACGRRFCDLASSTPPTSMVFPSFFVSAAHACAQKITNTHGMLDAPKAVFSAEDTCTAPDALTADKVPRAVSLSTWKDPRCHYLQECKLRSRLRRAMRV